MKNIRLVPRSQQLQSEAVDWLYYFTAALLLSALIWGAVVLHASASRGL